MLYALLLNYSGFRAIFMRQTTDNHTQVAIVAQCCRRAAPLKRSSNCYKRIYPQIWMDSVFFTASTQCIQLVLGSEMQIVLPAKFTAFWMTQAIRYKHITRGASPRIECVRLPPPLPSSRVPGSSKSSPMSRRLPGIVPRKTSYTATHGSSLTDYGTSAATLITWVIPLFAWSSSVAIGELSADVLLIGSKMRRIWVVRTLPLDCIYPFRATFHRGVR
ncbi:hypothetical protein A0H81_07840 [Grifola frondosa]|uniref:Uncharacterized protein n=1 Tax=Grifola frondosa TaxID=5627 RepID=A0A1C7M830_GRIFR|nr:hypothetical protein A0H81_07840 [Grifola frondosa]